MKLTRIILDVRNSQLFIIICILFFKSQDVKQRDERKIQKKMCINVYKLYTTLYKALTREIK